MTLYYQGFSEKRNEKNTCRQTYMHKSVLPEPVADHIHQL